MLKEDIQKINSKCSTSEQGVFFQPSMIPTHIKEYVIYKRTVISGKEGGNCWNNFNSKRFYNEDSDTEWEALDLVLEQLKPNITYLQYKKISKLVHTNEETEYEYYGNSTDYKVEYIILSELEKYLDSL